MGSRVAIAVLVVAVLAAPARASDDRIRRRGDCAGGPSEWKLIVRQETDTTLRVKWEIEGGASGQTWQVFLSDDGVRIYSRTKVSREDGYVRVVREIVDGAGTDLIKASSVNLETGETCSGSVSF